MDRAAFKFLSRAEFNKLTMEEQMEYMQAHVRELRKQLDETKRQLDETKKTLASLSGPPISG